MFKLLSRYQDLLEEFNGQHYSLVETANIFMNGYKEEY